MATRGATAAVTQETLENELKDQGRQLTVLRDAAVTAAGRRAGGYGGGTELDSFLRRASLPRQGDVVVSLPGGFEASHFTAEGLQHHLGQLREAHAAKIASLREGAIAALKGNYVRREDVDQAFADAGLEPLAEKTTVSINGRVSFPLAEGETAESVTAKLTAALNEATGSTVDIGGVNLTTDRKLA